MKILIIKTSALGDIIHAFPCLRYLRQKFPDAQIDWVVEKGSAEMVQAHPDVNRVLCIDTKTWRRGIFHKEHWRAFCSFRQALREVKYDVVFDLQGNIKSGLICAQAKAIHKVGFGKNSVPEWPNMLFTNRRYHPPQGRNIRDDYLFLLQSYFTDPVPFVDEGVLLRLKGEQKIAWDVAMKQVQQLKGDKVMVCPGSAWPNKQMTPEALTEFLTYLQVDRSCSFVLIWGTQEERQLAESLQGRFEECSVIVDRLPLPVLQNLMGQMDLVVAMDSLPLHLAGTTGVATFSIFGASSATKYKPEGPRHTTLQGGCPYGRTFEKRCPILRTCPTGLCIRGLSGQAVFTSFQQQSRHAAK